MVLEETPENVALKKRAPQVQPRSKPVALFDHAIRCARLEPLRCAWPLRLAVPHGSASQAVAFFFGTVFFFALVLVLRLVFGFSLTTHLPST